jgi:hypothetical protein
MRHPPLLTPQPPAPQTPILNREAPFAWDRLPLERQHELITTLAAILLRQLPVTLTNAPEKRDEC